MQVSVSKKAISMLFLVVFICLNPGQLHVWQGFHSVIQALSQVEWFTTTVQYMYYHLNDTTLICYECEFLQ